MGGAARKRAGIGIILLCLIVCFCLPARSAMAKNRFQRSSVKLETGPRVFYWVYVPEDQPADGLPLVVYIHGSGEWGERALKAALPALINDGAIERFPAVLLVPQMPQSGKWYLFKNQVVTMVERVSQAYDTDPERMTLTGFSMGATFCWDFANSYPEMFPRIASVCGRIEHADTQLEAFAGSYVRTYVGTKDVNVPPESSMDFTRQLIDEGYAAELFVLEATHAQMQKNMFLDQDLLDWLCYQETVDDAADGENSVEE